METFSQAYVQADFFGKLIFFALFLLSCGCSVFAIQKFLLLKRVKLSAKHFQKIAEMRKEEILNVNAKSKTSFPILYNVLKEKTLAILDKNHFFSGENQNYLSNADVEFLDSHLHAAITKEREKIERNLFILPMTTTLAPFLGLLGTVWGILITFGEMQAGHSITSNSAVLGGLSTALTTTVLGLLVAIPTLVAYSYLKSASRRFTIEMVDFSHFLLSTVELQYRKVDVHA